MFNWELPRKGSCTSRMLYSLRYKDSSARPFVTYAFLDECDEFELSLNKSAVYYYTEITIKCIISSKFWNFLSENRKALLAKSM